MSFRAVSVGILFHKKHSISSVVQRISITSLFLSGRSDPTSPIAMSHSIPEKRHLKLHSQVFMIPHPKKKHKGGEDGYFVNENGTAIGVADGVGGWAEHGVGIYCSVATITYADPGEYAKKLMLHAHSASLLPDLCNNPESIMNYAYNKCKSIVGSSTACVLVLNQPSQLKTANLGDSGFFILRDVQPFFRSKEQQKAFNFPYQLGSGSPDKPSHSDKHTIDVKEGDLIVVGTDGLFDNLFDKEIVTVISQITDGTTKRDTQYWKNLMQKKNIAEIVAQAAFQKAKSPTAVTPFSKHAEEAGYLFEGGKLDDITVVVSVVVESDGNNNISSKL